MYAALLYQYTQTLLPTRSAAYIEIISEPDSNPKKYGLDLLFPSHPLADFIGFPA